MDWRAPPAVGEFYSRDSTVHHRTLGHYPTLINSKTVSVCSESAFLFPPPPLPSFGVPAGAVIARSLRDNRDASRSRWRDTPRNGFTGIHIQKSSCRDRDHS